MVARNMNLQKFTIKAQEAIQTSREIAASYSNQSLEPEHLLAAMLSGGKGLAIDIIGRIGVDVGYFQVKTTALLEHLPKVTPPPEPASQFVSPGFARLLDESMKVALSLKDEFVSIEHMLIAMSESKSPAGRLLSENGVSRDTILKVLVAIRGNRRVTDQNPEDKYQALERYGRNLNEEARRGRLDPVIGREEKSAV
jgi:ATP-dependent Clp protease ATP-binding subunit ClpB